MKKSILLAALVAAAAAGTMVSCKGEDLGIMPPIVGDGTLTVDNGVVTVNPTVYSTAFRNPMKGWREFFGPGIDRMRVEYPYPYGSMIKEYMQWNMLEDKESDGVDKIIAYSNHRWAGVEDINVKVIPRIFIIWEEPWHGGVAKNVRTNHPDDIIGWHWPSDIPGESWDRNPEHPITGGYTDPSFPSRVEKLVKKAAEAWDNDPRVAYIEMGIIGEWGEHHDPDITTYWAPHDQPKHVENLTWLPGIEKTLGDIFTSEFKNKKVMVRYAYEFKDYKFGYYWDAWAAEGETKRGYEEIKKLGDRWKDQVIGGELTWNAGFMGDCRSLEDVVSRPEIRTRIINQVRDLHCNHLGGVTWANFNDPSFIPNADLLQRTMGYRFILTDFKYPTRIKSGEKFKVEFDVTNTGSSPFYYNWPVEVALLDAVTHQPVWSAVLKTPKTSEWMPGDDWDSAQQAYTKRAPVNHVEEELVAENIPDGKYIISIAVLDPAGMQPSLRFAVANYFEGGRHPMGYIGVNEEPEKFYVSSKEFFDIQSDKTLKYKVSLDL